MDILEEHISQLMNEIKKKNRIIQSYVMNIEPGALISEESDIHKVRKYFAVSANYCTHVKYQILLF